MRIRMVAGLLLALSLGLKLHGDYAVPADDHAGVLRVLAANLARDGYDVRLELVGRTRVTATRGGCRMVVRLLDPHATYQAITSRTLSVEGRVAYIWRGAWRESLPRLGPLMEYYFKRELARQGLAVSRHPVWLAALGPQCRVRPDARFADITVALLPAVG